MLSALPTSPNISDVSALGKEVMISVALLIAVPLGLNLVLSVGASRSDRHRFCPESTETEVVSPVMEAGLQESVQQKVGMGDR